MCSLQESLQTGRLICLTGSSLLAKTWPHTAAIAFLDCVNTCGLPLTLIERESYMTIPPGHRVCNYPTGVQLHQRIGKIRGYKKKEGAVGCGQQKQPQILI